MQRCARIPDDLLAEAQSVALTGTLFAGRPTAEGFTIRAHTAPAAHQLRGMGEHRASLTVEERILHARGIGATKSEALDAACKKFLGMLAGE